MDNKYYVVITSSDEVDFEKIRISQDVLSKMKVKRGDPVEVSVNGKKITLTVDYNSNGENGSIKVSNTLANAIGMNGRYIGNIRKLKNRELKKVVFKVKNSWRRMDINYIRSNLLLRPASKGSMLLVNSATGIFELEVVECFPKEGLISTNTLIVFS